MGEHPNGGGCQQGGLPSAHRWPRHCNSSPRPQGWWLTGSRTSIHRSLSYARTMQQPVPQHRRPCFRGLWKCTSAVLWRAVGIPRTCLGRSMDLPDPGGKLRRERSPTPPSAAPKGPSGDVRLRSMSRQSAPGMVLQRSTCPRMVCRGGTGDHYHRGRLSSQAPQCESHAEFVTLDWKRRRSAEAFCTELRKLGSVRPRAIPAVHDFWGALASVRSHRAKLLLERSRTTGEQRWTPRSFDCGDFFLHETCLLLSGVDPMISAHRAHLKGAGGGGEVRNTDRNEP